MQTTAALKEANALTAKTIAERDDLAMDLTVARAELAQTAIALDVAKRELTLMKQRPLWWLLQYIVVREAKIAACFLAALWRQLRARLLPVA